MLTVPTSTWSPAATTRHATSTSGPQAKGGGFRDEVLKKYDEETFELFQMLFWHLPIAAMIGGQIFMSMQVVTRGGRRWSASNRSITRKISLSGRQITDENLLLTAWSDPERSRRRLRPTR